MSLRCSAWGCPLSRASSMAAASRPMASRGVLMLAMILAVYLRSPAPEFALALAVSMLTLQGAAQPLVAMSLVMISLFAPAVRASVRPDPISAPDGPGVERPPAPLTERQPVGGP